MRIKKTLISKIKNYKSRLCVIVLCNLMAAVFTILSFFLLEPFIKLLFSGSTDELNPLNQFVLSFLSKLIDIHELTPFITAIGILFILFFLFKNVFAVLSSWLMATIKSRFIQGLRNEIYERITILPLSYFSQRKRGDIVSRAVNDVQELENTLLRSLQQFLTDPITVLLLLLTLFFVDYKLTLFTLFLIPVAGFFITLAKRKLRKNSVASKEGLGQMLSHVEESLSGLRIIKGFNAQHHAAEGFDRENKKYSTLFKRILWSIDLASPLSEFLGIIVIMVVLVFGGWQVIYGTGNLTAPMFIVYIIIIVMIINPAKNIAAAFANYQRGYAVLERVEEVLLADEKIVQTPNAISIHDFKDKIEY